LRRPEGPDRTSAGDYDPAAIARARELLDGFLSGRADRTSRAYTTDVQEFARFLDLTPAEALARLLADGPDAGRRVVFDFAMHLRRRDRARTTIERRLGTLRAVARAAQEQGVVDWQLEVPGGDEISVAAGTLPARDNEHYLFPRHPGEVDRLDIQHYALRETLGANHLSPLDAPRRILDVGCGTGQWGFEMCVQYDPAFVVGMDLVPSKPGQPGRYCYVKGNVLQGLPFAGDRFDFVHQRLLVSAIPLAAWPAMVRDLARVARPGGWVELVEVPWEIERAGPAAQRLVDLTRELTAALGLDATGEVYRSLDAYLRAAGLANVERIKVSVPVGRWGGQVGSLMVSDFRAGVTRVCEVLQARGRLTADESRTMIQEAQEEWEHGGLAYPFAIARGRKPG
jgi:SAM-dependent methyltransferase